MGKLLSHDKTDTDIFSDKRDPEGLRVSTYLKGVCVWMHAYMCMCMCNFFVLPCIISCLGSLYQYIMHDHVLKDQSAMVFLYCYEATRYFW